MAKKWISLGLLAFAIGLILFGILEMIHNARGEAGSPPMLIPSPYDRMLLDLDEQAINEAYKIQVQQLFAVWMKDDKDQPRRAVVGVHHARTAFIAAMGEISKRRQQLPPKND